MFTDSHCHLTFTELLSQLPAIRQAMQESQAQADLRVFYPGFGDLWRRRHRS